MEASLSLIKGRYFLGVQFQNLPGKNWVLLENIVHNRFDQIVAGGVCPSQSSVSEYLCGMFTLVSNKVREGERGDIRVNQDLGMQVLWQAGGAHLIRL